jgi:3-methyladenine DNA glycosylase AlkC
MTDRTGTVSKQPSRNHPSQRFSAPSTIQRGVPLKSLMDSHLVSLIGQSLSDVVPGFQRKTFVRQATHGLDQLELKERAAHIAHAMREQLPADFDQAAPFLIQSLGPPLTSTEGNGLAVFFYLPHAQLIAAHGVDRFESGMMANYELTQRFTAEFSIRPFLMQYRSPCLKRLARWTTDKNAHVRRLVSEGTRSRLPWAMRLPEFQQDPGHTLPLLEALKDDVELYVLRSVANHLGDIAKDHPDVVFDLCEQWLHETSDSDENTAENRRWIIRHALRHPAKKGSQRATQLRKQASP